MRKNGGKKILIKYYLGGFVSGSSAMHEGYLREWANQTGVIVLSVDYRLAPQHKFPTALDECYFVYKWLMTTCNLGKEQFFFYCLIYVLIST